MTDKWTDRLRTEMEDFQSTDIPEGLWEGIEQKLDAKPVVSSPWRRYAAAAVAVLLVCGSAGLLFLRNAGTDGTKDTAKTEQKKLDMGGTLTPIANDAIASAMHPEGIASAPSPSFYPPIPTQCGEVIPEASSLRSQGDIAATPDNGKEDVRQEKDTEDENAEAARKANGTGYSAASGFNSRQASGIASRHVPGSGLSRLSARVFTAMSAQADASARQGYMALSANGVPDNERPAFSKSPFGKLDKLYLANALDTDEEVVSEAKHSLPVRLGMSIGYDINSRWTLNAGMAYTKLHSTLTSGTSSSHFTNNQDIHYLGVPVSIHYNIMNTRHLRLYGAAGGMVEFGVKGDVEVTNVTKGKVVSVEHNSVTNIPVQYSANAAFGAEYVMLHGIGIYAEPGLSYYIKNSSGLSTIYSDHPLNFSLQLGVRWNIIQR